MLEVGEVVHKRFHTRGTHEDEHVVVKILYLLWRKVVGDGAIHHTFRMVQFLRVEQFGDVVVMVVAQWHKILLLFVLRHCGQQVFHLARSTEKHLTFTVLNVFLDIERNGLGYAKILQRLGNGHA